MGRWMALHHNNSWPRSEEIRLVSVSCKCVKRGSTVHSQQSDVAPDWNLFKYYLKVNCEALSVQHNYSAQRSFPKLPQWVPLMCHMFLHTINKKWIPDEFKLLPGISHKTNGPWVNYWWVLIKERAENRLPISSRSNTVTSLNISSKGVNRHVIWW